MWPRQNALMRKKHEQVAALGTSRAPSYRAWSEVKSTHIQLLMFYSTLRVVLAGITHDSLFGFE